MSDLELFGLAGLEALMAFLSFGMWKWRRQPIYPVLMWVAAFWAAFFVILAVFN